MKMACCAPAAATAWVNRTGLRRLATQCSASKGAVRRTHSRVAALLPPGGDEHRDGRRLRRQVGQFGAQVAEHRVDDRMVGGDVDVDPPRQPILSGDHRDHGVDLIGRAGDDDLVRRGLDRDGALRVTGKQLLGGGAGQFQQRHRALSGQPRHQPRPRRDHFQAVGRRSAHRPPPRRSPRPSSDRSPRPASPRATFHSAVSAS